MDRADLTSDDPADLKHDIDRLYDSLTAECNARIEAEQQLAEAQREKEQAVASWLRMAAERDWLLEYIDQRVDIRDGSNGEQLPNDWMSLQLEYQQEFSRPKEFVSAITTDAEKWRALKSYAKGEVLGAIATIDQAFEDAKR